MMSQFAGDNQGSAFGDYDQVLETINTALANNHFYDAIMLVTFFDVLRANEYNETATIEDLNFMPAGEWQSITEDYFSSWNHTNVMSDVPPSVAFATQAIIRGMVEETRLRVG
ncbi:hypothetical protein BABINDRAFT_10078 [Babjeviella inositovora NRRL Y-12698]|uniref:Uncharacterized protein n=1 Tax=Babjeviella inositovora NRRL Y-12698 TaxID=984486 RepID=A0A1E3QIG3_9ASCO|nr:uncharacterized protein BABINDRAFT_10078 [Babjeviella inositovora NRRL Y-12698]ODQ77430.1 hypothetical protein BABINDRAFT_10078 [Babjeviella inositovora NRRL Y-12698]